MLIKQDYPRIKAWLIPMRCLAYAGLLSSLTFTERLFAEGVGESNVIILKLEKCLWPVKDGKEDEEKFIAMVALYNVGKKPILISSSLVGRFTYPDNKELPEDIAGSFPAAIAFFSIPVYNTYIKLEPRPVDEKGIKLDGKNAILIWQKNEDKSYFTSISQFKCAVKVSVHDDHGGEDIRISVSTE